MTIVIPIIACGQKQPSSGLLARAEVRAASVDAVDAINSKYLAFLGETLPPGAFFKRTCGGPHLFRSRRRLPCRL